MVSAPGSTWGSADAFSSSPPPSTPLQGPAAYKRGILHQEPSAMLASCRCATQNRQKIFPLSVLFFWHATLMLHIVWKYKTRVACKCSEIDLLQPTYKTDLKTMRIHFLSLQVTSNLSHKDLLRSRLNWLQRRSPSPLKGTASTVLCLHLINQLKLSNLCCYLFNRPAPWRLLCRALQPMGHTDANHRQPQFPHLWQLCMTRGTRTKELQVWETKY